MLSCDINQKHYKYEAGEEGSTQRSFLILVELLKLNGLFWKDGGCLDPEFVGIASSQ